MRKDLTAGHSIRRKEHALLRMAHSSWTESLRLLKTPLQIVSLSLGCHPNLVFIDRSFLNPLAELP